MNYADMTDFEINKAVAEARGGYGGVGYDPTGEGNVVNAFDTEFGAALYTERDYCNDPADAWPVIFQNSIALNPICSLNNDSRTYELTGQWRACAEEFGVYVESEHENPLRAAMIVYLMMQADQ